MTEMVCIVCPNGCHLQVEPKDGDYVVTGNLCKRGEAFGRSEMICPMRTISSTVKTTSQKQPVVSVKVNGEIPKDKIFDVMKEIQKVKLAKDMDIGDVVICDVLGLHVDVVVTTPLRYG